MCTRTLYVGSENLVITGRNMDWKEDMFSNLWAFPAGMERHGASGPASIRWTSKYGSLVVSGYEIGTVDGMNEQGLVANLHYLAEAEYGTPNRSKPLLCIAAWCQYVLDLHASVAEAVHHLRSEPFHLLAPDIPGGQPATLHLSISDKSGDSAIFEYVKGRLEIHHDRSYKVMTNSPVYEEQLAINAYWKQIGGLVFMPGTNRAADRFVRASFLIDAIPKHRDENYIRSVPQQSYTLQAVASVLSVQRAVSVPLGISTPNEPNISSTIWRTVADQKNLTFFFDAATSPDTFWVSLPELGLNAGQPVKKLTLQDGAVFAGNATKHFMPAPPFEFHPAQPPAA
jgi:choloylglycine hydrolase